MMKTVVERTGLCTLGSLHDFPSKPNRYRHDLDFVFTKVVTNNKTTRQYDGDGLRKFVLQKNFLQSVINKDLYKPKRLIAAKHCIIGLNPSQINKYQSGSTMYSENVQHILKNLVKKQAYIENKSENNIIRDSSKHNVSMFGGKRRHRRSTKEIVPVVPVAAKVFVTNEQKKSDLPDFLLPTRPTRRVIFKRKKKYPVFNPFHSLDVKLLLIAVIIYLVYFNL